MLARAQQSQAGAMKASFHQSLSLPYISILTYNMASPPTTPGLGSEAALPINITPDLQHPSGYPVLGLSRNYQQ